MTRLLLILILASPIWAKGNNMNDMIDKLIPALIEKESSRNPNAIGDDGRAIGILQIHKCVVDDVNQYLFSTHYDYSCRESEFFSKQICEIYLFRWGKAYERKEHKNITLEVLARIWNGGPDGWKKKSTLVYWSAVKAIMEKRK